MCEWEKNWIEVTTAGVKAKGFVNIAPAVFLWRIDQWAGGGCVQLLLAWPWVWSGIERNKTGNRCSADTRGWVLDAFSLFACPDSLLPKGAVYPLFQETRNCSCPRRTTYLINGNLHRFHVLSKWFVFLCPAFRIVLEGSQCVIYQAKQPQRIEVCGNITCFTRYLCKRVHFPEISG